MTRKGIAEVIRYRAAAATATTFVEVDEMNRTTCFRSSGLQSLHEEILVGLRVRFLKLLLTTPSARAQAFRHGMLYERHLPAFGIPIEFRGSARREHSPAVQLNTSKFHVASYATSRYALENLCALTRTRNCAHIIALTVLFSLSLLFLAMLPD